VTPQRLSRARARRVRSAFKFLPNLQCCLRRTRHFAAQDYFIPHGAVSPIVHGAVAFDHWSCRTFSHPKVIFSLSVGGSPLPLRFVLTPVVMVFSKLSPRPNWNVSCYCGEREWVSYAMATSITRLD